MEEKAAAKRSANFSTNDCLLLAQIMGENCGVENLSHHNYLRHRFSKTITSKSKKEMWQHICNNFSSRAQVPREIPNLTKKWDNLVQTHKNLYADHKRSLQKTGGGQGGNPLGALTEAVMDVVGRENANVIGIPDTNACDAAQICLNVQDVSVEVCSSGDTFTIQDMQVQDLNIMTPILSSMENPSPLISSASTPSPEQCCACSCHSRFQVLKEEKLRLQIAVLKKQLAED